MPSSFHALIRTHHITSRKKVSTLRAAARERGVACMLRSGGVPGLMYVRGARQADVAAWVEAVRALRYKDYTVVAPVAAVEDDGDGSGGSSGSTVGRKKQQQSDGEKSLDGLAGFAGFAGFSFEEVGEVKDFGQRMDDLGLREWWRAAMGYAKE